MNEQQQPGSVRRPLRELLYLLNPEIPSRYLLSPALLDDNSQASSWTNESLLSTSSPIILDDIDSLAVSPTSDRVSDFVEIQAGLSDHSPSYSIMSTSPSSVYSAHSPLYSPSEDSVDRSISPFLHNRPRSPDYPPPGFNQDPDPNVQIINPPEEQVIEPLDVVIIDPPPPTEEPQIPQEPEDPPPDPETAQAKRSEPVPVLNVSTLSDAEDTSLCSICMDPLTTSGNHRIVCLRCGHIFGQSCVERWIKVGCTRGAKRCPTCNKKACLKDIRVLYATKVVPLDTSEKERLLQEKQELVAQKMAVQIELSKCQIRNKFNTKKYEEKIMRLEKELAESVNAIEYLTQGKKVVLPDIDVKHRAELVYTVDISKEGGCRVMTFNHFSQELVVSQPSGNTIFAAYGVRVLNNCDFQPTRFVYLHSKMIRDLAFHGDSKDVLLSVSLDQSAKLVDLANSTTIHIIKGQGQLWSCCWDVSNPNLMLLGTQSGKVLQYDRRKLDKYVNLWETHDNATPVVALASAPSMPDTPFPQGGFFSCRLNRIYVYSRNGESYRKQEILSEGPFMSMRYDYNTTHSLLTTSRPSSRCPYTKLYMNSLDVDMKGNICAPEIHTFNCGSSARVMSRMTIVPALNNSLVVAHHESGRSVNIWSASSGDLVQSLPVKEPVIDLASTSSSNNTCFLATLSDKKVGIFKVV